MAVVLTHLLKLLSLFHRLSLFRRYYLTLRLNESRVQSTVVLSVFVVQGNCINDILTAFIMINSSSMVTGQMDLYYHTQQ